MKGSLMVATNRQRMEGQACFSKESVERLASASPLPSMVRGACPSLSAPMQTGDGLLVRLRPTTPGLTVAQFRALAEAAEAYGNGLIEITARGNLQLRGMTPESMEGLAADIDRAGIIPESGVAIEVPPLSGLDPTEIAGARALAERLRKAIDDLTPKPLLAAKLAIIVDGGGQLTLDGLSADIRLKATKSGDSAHSWSLAIAGTEAAATLLATLSEENAITSAITVLKALALLGPRARGRDLDPADLRRQFSSTPISAADRAGPSASSPVGIFPLGANSRVLGLRPAFGQIHARDIIRFLAVVEEEGVTEIRTGPEHSLLLLGLTADKIERVRTVAASCGFQTQSDDPANYIVPCSGAGACTSAHYPTKKAAAEIVYIAPELLDGSFKLHLSGCPKGCAHPGPTALTIVGAATGHGIVVNGSASAEPVAHIGRESLKSALAELSGLVRNNKAAGESARQCLKRLGRDAIATALRQG